MASDRFDLFPTTRAIPEAMQIGRKAFIDSVQGAVVHGANVLLLEERRTGKSSVAHAVIERLRTEEPAGHVGLVVDLTDGAANSEALARELRRQAGQQNALKLVARSRLAAKEAGAKAQRFGSRNAENVGKILGTPGEDEAIAAVVAELLPDIGQPSLRAILEALDKHARDNDFRVVIFIDEVQELAKWPDAAEVKSVIATVSGRMGTHLNFIFAGSETSAIEAMFGPNDPLDFFGDRMHLPEIADQAWQRELGRRFKKAKLTIDHQQIAEILYETERHPGRTIHVCRQILTLTSGDVVTSGIVKQAITLHRNDPAWKKRR